MDTQKQDSDHENETNVRQSGEEGLAIEQQAAAVEDQPKNTRASQYDDRCLTSLKRSRRIQTKILQKRENELKAEKLRLAALKNQLTNLEASQSDDRCCSTPKRSARIQLRKLWKKQAEYSIQKGRVVALESHIPAPNDKVNQRDDRRSATPTGSNQQHRNSDIQKQTFKAIEIPTESKRLSLRGRVRKRAASTTACQIQQRSFKDRKEKSDVNNPRPSTPESKKAIPKRRRTTSQRRSVDSELDYFDDFIKYLENIPDKIIPEFDPIRNKPTMKQWLRKVDKCAEQNGWTEEQVIKYALPKLTGHSKIWYQDLKPRKRTWDKWKVLLEETFPINYVEMFNRMVKIMNPSKTFKTSMDKKNLVGR